MRIARLRALTHLENKHNAHRYRGRNEDCPPKGLTTHFGWDLVTHDHRQTLGKLIPGVFFHCWQSQPVRRRPEAPNIEHMEKLQIRYIELHFTLVILEGRENCRKTEFPRCVWGELLHIGMNTSFGFGKYMLINNHVLRWKWNRHTVKALTAALKIQPASRPYQT